MDPCHGCSRRGGGEGVVGVDLWGLARQIRQALGSLGSPTRKPTPAPCLRINGVRAGASDVVVGDGARAPDRTPAGALGLDGPPPDDGSGFDVTHRTWSGTVPGTRPQRWTLKPPGIGLRSRRTGDAQTPRPDSEGVSTPTCLGSPLGPLLRGSSDVPALTTPTPLSPAAPHVDEQKSTRPTCHTS